jgi:hypothetical protein
MDTQLEQTHVFFIAVDIDLLIGRDLRIIDKG